MLLQNMSVLIRGLKRLKYEKRKMSPSPNRHPMPSSVSMRQPSPYRDDRYMSSRPVATRPSHYSPSPPKKKIKSSSMMIRRPEIPQHSEDRMAPRREMPPSRPSLLPHPSMHRGHMDSSTHNERSFDSRSKGHGSGSAPPSQSKRPPPPSIKPPYRGERYQSPPDTDRYPTIESEKHYAPTLHERFSTVVESTRTEPRIKYSREDLEKITIDIRNHKSESPTLRRIVNPDDVKLVRRTNEGHRPIFDREEIKQAPKDMRDDAHYEKKVTGYSSRHAPMGLPSGVDNYEITRHRFDSHQQTFHSSGGRSLSDRWQSEVNRKDEPPLDRDLRETAYERPPMKRNFSDSRPSKGGDRDFRSERYSGPSTSQSRHEFPPNHHVMAPSSDSRNSSSLHRKPISPIDARRKLTTVRRGSDRGLPPTMRPDSKSRYPPAEKRYPDNMSGRIQKPIERRSPVMEPEWKRQSRPDSREKMSSFSRKPDKYSYNKPLPEKYDPSKNSNYYPDVRGSSDSYRGRGSSFRSPRGRSSRGIRGSTRGSYPIRSSFRGGYRGRGAPRRGRVSPHVWEHDMYSRTPDQKMDFP